MRVKIRAHDVHNALLRKASRRALRGVSRRAVRQGLEMIAEEARRLAPVDTGALRESIHVEMSPGGTNGEVVVGTSGGPEYYAMFVEFGTAHMPARPFLRPAADAVRDRIQRQLAKSVADAVTRS